MPTVTLECPLKPVPEKSLVATTGFSPIPANACTRERCAFWLRLQTPEGMVGNCAVPILAIGVLNVEGSLRTLVSATVQPALPGPAPVPPQA